MRPVRTRFSSLDPWAARGVLILLGCLIGYGILHSPEPPPPETSLEEGVGDVFLYRAIVDRVRAGEDYYTVVSEELPERGYAVRPFLNWRLPTTALLIAAFPSDSAAAWFLRALAFLAILVLSVKLYLETLSIPKAIVGAVLLTGAVGLTVNDHALFFHEVWAMVFVTISLTVYHPKHWLGSVLLGTTALFFRELALGFVGAMMLAGVLAGRRREVLGWIGGATVFFVALAIHASVVSGFLSGGGPAKSWLALGGWTFVLSSAEWNFFLLLAPGWVTAIVVPLGLFGAVAWKSHLGLQISLILGSYLCAYMIVGNPDNEYWGIMYAPFLALGLLYAADGLVDLSRAARGSG